MFRSVCVCVCIHVHTCMSVYDNVHVCTCRYSALSSGLYVLPVHTFAAYLKCERSL